MSSEGCCPLIGSTETLRFYDLWSSVTFDFDFKQGLHLIRQKQEFHFDFKSHLWYNYLLLKALLSYRCSRCHVQQLNCSFTILCNLRVTVNPTHPTENWIYRPNETNPWVVPIHDQLYDLSQLSIKTSLRICTSPGGPRQSRIVSNQHDLKPRLDQTSIVVMGHGRYLRYRIPCSTMAQESFLTSPPVPSVGE